MLLSQQYARLRISLLRDRQSEEALPVTVDEIAGLLHCTERNAKLVLHRMSELGWIVWLPGRGRGHRSQIRFEASAEELLMQDARAAVEQGNLNGAMSVFRMEGIDPWIAERFLAWLGGFFGYKEAGDRGEDTLRLPMRVPVHTLDPARLLYSRDLHFAKQVFDTLVRFDPEQRRILPQLAHSWECDDQAKVWTFYLRKGVRFHHGRELAASDVVYSLLRLRAYVHAPASDGWLAECIADVRATGRRTVEVELSAPNYMFLHYVSAYPTAIVPEEIYRNGGAGGMDLDRLPVGTGPFRVARHEAGVLTLAAFPEYWRERALLDRIEMLVVPKELQQRPDPLFHMGKLHHVEHIRFEVPANWEKMQVLTLGCSLLTINLRKLGPLQDARLREAIDVALDRTGLARELGKDGPARGFLPPTDGGSVAAPPEDCQYAYARRLIADAGYAGEVVRFFSLPYHLAQTEWVRRQCEAVGIRMEIVQISYEEASDPARMAEADLAIGGVVADDDEDRCLLEMYKMDGMPVRAYATDAQREAFDAEIESIVAEPDEETRRRRIRGLERLLTDARSVLFLLHTTQETVFNPDVRGIALNTLG
ncbi:ABC transporter substrate-binding protein [Cohnella nanjingensis]|uniref:SgrR family transcriptional regulator n=1 Tax=Cohnella nanjingensis TaxID=1387779 RepID=A0A7X0RTG8_9BACL|nr:ABC transporter substrate-binding protein [Cohnella nanjingensis]MBB6672166.1 SgrR family transcriptional regulator [Cohnella nanjingensis]